MTILRYLLGFAISSLAAYLVMLLYFELSKLVNPYKFGWDPVTVRLIDMAFGGAVVTFVSTLAGSVFMPKEHKRKFVIAIGIMLAILVVLAEMMEFRIGLLSSGISCGWLAVFLWYRKRKTKVNVLDSELVQ